MDEKISAVAELLSESWRLNQFTRNLAVHVADEKLRRKISNQVARFDKKFLQATQVFGLDVVDFTGGRFRSGGTVGVTRNVFVSLTLSPRRDSTTEI